MWSADLEARNSLGQRPAALHITEAPTGMPASRGPSDLDATWLVR